MQLGKLTYLKLSERWPHEERDFTPWLCEEENLNALAGELGLELQFERAEVPVGPYCADILAKDASGAVVVIENQFHKSNHDHLGKLLTYGATLGASVVIWIAEEFSEEHQKAVEWLNERTNDELALYAVQPELFRIDDSNPAVRFRVIGRPNQTVKNAATTARGELSEAQQLQLEFWTQFQNLLLERRIVASAQTPRPQYWFDVPLGRSNIHLSNILSTTDGKLGIRVYLNNRVADRALEQLMVERQALEAEIGSPLVWNPNPDNRDKIIALFRSIEPDNRAAWPEYLDWLANMTGRFRAAFSPRVRKLKLPAENVVRPN